MAAAPSPLSRLLHRLDLEPGGHDRFIGHPGRGEGRVFGGMILAQAVVAAGRSVAEDGAPHALHAHFLRAGRHGIPIEWSVRRLRDGRTYVVREVTGRQSGERILTMTASFTHAREGLAHRDVMPGAPPPESCPDWEDLRVAILGDPAARHPDGPLEVRDCDPASAVPAPGRAARRALWIRPRGTPPDQPLVHAALLAYASDRGLLSTAARPHGLMWGQRLGASLDHALWLHGPARFDGWVLAVSDSPVAVAGRALVLAAIYAPDGNRIASVAQEGLLRARPVDRRRPPS